MTQTSMENRYEAAPVNTYQFVLVLNRASDLNDTVHDALHEAGCDDAVLGCVDDIFYLDFDREASSRAEAVSSAMENVESVLGVGACYLQTDAEIC